MGGDDPPSFWQAHPALHLAADLAGRAGALEQGGGGGEIVAEGGDDGAGDAAGQAPGTGGRRGRRRISAAP